MKRFVANDLNIINYKRFRSVSRATVIAVYCLLLVGGNMFSTYGLVWAALMGKMSLGVMKFAH